MLGFEFYNQEGTPVPLGAKGLCDLAHIETKNALAVLSECRFTVACDVKNPLCGENGCSAVFAPQKGASPEAVKAMDEWLSRYAALTEKAVLFYKFDIIFVDKSKKVITLYKSAAPWRIFSAKCKLFQSL